MSTLETLWQIDRDLAANEDIYRQMADRATRLGWDDLYKASISIESGISIARDRIARAIRESVENTQHS